MTDNLLMLKVILHIFILFVYGCNISGEISVLNPDLLNQQPSDSTKADFLKKTEFVSLSHKTIKVNEYSVSGSIGSITSESKKYNLGDYKVYLQFESTISSLD